MDEGLSEDEEDPKQKARLSADGWIFRIWFNSWFHTIASLQGKPELLLVK